MKAREAITSCGIPTAIIISSPSPDLRVVAEEGEEEQKEDKDYHCNPLTTLFLTGKDTVCEREPPFGLLGGHVTPFSISPRVHMDRCRKASGRTRSYQVTAFIANVRAMFVVPVTCGVHLRT